MPNSTPPTPEATALAPVAVTRMADALRDQINAGLPVTSTRGVTGQPSGGPLVRTLQMDRAAVDEVARTVALSFASETPYERYWGVEILDCTPGAMDTSRLRDRANLLCDHDTTDVVGVIESVEIGTDRVGRAVVRFGKSVRAEEVWQDVLGGIRGKVSVGYMINDAVLESTKDGLDTYRVTSWTPHEVSLVSVPADASVGVGRSATAITVTPVLNPTQKENIMTTTVPAAPAAAAERNHAAEIMAIAAGIAGGAELGMRSIQAGHTTEQFQAEAIKALATRPIPTADIGMDQKEVKQYSVLRALNALANPGDAQAQKDAAFERECSSAYATKSGKASRGIFVPPEIQRRDLNVGTSTAGGNTVATNLLTGSFIDLLRNAMVLGDMGVVYLPGLVGNVAIPKHTGSATAYWVIEGAAPSESQQTIGQISMTPKTIGGYTDFTRRMFLQSSINVEQFIMGDLAKTVGLGIQQAVFTGAGTTGLLNGLFTQVAATVIGGTNGLAPTWDHIVDMETNVSVANADMGSMGYLTNAKMRGKLKKTFVNGTGGTERVWQDGADPLNGYRATVTNAIASNGTKGTGTNLSSIAFGNWADLVIGLWGGLDLMVDPYTASTTGTVRVVALQDVDMAIRNLESFATMTDAITV